ncbi:MAG: FAD-dependent monooxygenase [Candidatus Kapaibacteriota bacterium]
MMKAQKYIIAGGGIGGLTTVIALQQQGFEAHVYEAAQEIKAVGAGILLAPNAIEIFHRLGLKEEILRGGYPIKQGIVSDVQGRTLQVFTPSELSGNHHPTVPIQRSVLQTTLVSRLKAGTLHMGKVFATINDVQNQVAVRFEDGSEAEGTVLIGADGIRSRVRTSLFGEVQYRYSGQTCWRGLTEYHLPEREKMYEMWGTKSGVRVGYAPVSEEKVYFFATACKEAGGIDTKGSIHATLRELYDEFPPQVQQMLASTPEENILRNDIWDFAPIPSWHKGNTVLLGDAAHATTPNLGQGGCQAIEDDYALAKTIAEQTRNSTSNEEAFKHYEALRMKKAHFVVETSHRAGNITNWGGIAARVRNAALALAPKNLGRKQMEYLFEVTY